jgi:putative tryptophan/tyrosine transport system substrate-binding protein
MRRREFITLIGGAAAWPVAARAQQKMPRIGILLLTNEEIMGPYRQALRDLGYIEGKSIRPIDYQKSLQNLFAAGLMSSWPL